MYIFDIIITYRIASPIYSFPYDLFIGTWDF